jgi:hypothetical protein
MEILLTSARGETCMNDFLEARAALSDWHVPFCRKLEPLDPSAVLAAIERPAARCHSPRSRQGGWDQEQPCVPSSLLGRECDRWPQCGDVGQKFSTYITKHFRRGPQSNAGTGDSLMTCAWPP